MQTTGRTTDQIAADITGWGAHNIDADEMGKLLILALRAVDRGASLAEIRAIIDDGTAA
jgi:hypothetical protein